MSQVATDQDEISREIQGLRWSGISDVGRFRRNNEDAFLALTFDAKEIRYLGKTGEGSIFGADFVFAVSDGMGGAKSGEFASKIAIEKITQLLPKSLAIRAVKMESGSADVMAELFERIHQAMLHLGKAYEECHGMGATLSLCWFTEEWMHFGHIGDSRIYYLPSEGKMTQITEDHTYVGLLYREGKINEREARSHPLRNRLLQVMGGSAQNLDPHLGRVKLCPGDRFLICSDGLTDGLRDHKIEDISRKDSPSGELSTKALIQESISESGKDNTTAILIEVL
jgi:PPM family protein phosphatase